MSTWTQNRTIAALVGHVEGKYVCNRHIRGYGIEEMISKSLLLVQKMLWKCKSELCSMKYLKNTANEADNFGKRC